MVSVITVASLLCLALGVGVLLMRRRRVGFSGLENVSVSRRWLMQHQADDRS
jgi:hypothetical protein